MFVSPALQRWVGDCENWSPVGTVPIDSKYKTAGRSLPLGKITEIQNYLALLAATLLASRAL